MSEFWKTELSRVRENEILVRGYPIESLVRGSRFGDVMFLLLTGEMPTGQQGRLIEAILVACCEHSLASPSVCAVRFVASSGVPLQTAVAAGISAIGDVHGGAMEKCAEVLQAAVKNGTSPEAIFRDLKTCKQRLPGFGHAVHTRDPRVNVLFDLAAELGLAGPHCALARRLEQAAPTAIGRELNMNVDGAIGALLCDIGIEPGLGKTFFIVARATGYAAHAFEQTTRERPFKAPDPEDITYGGPGPRELHRP